METVIKGRVRTGDEYFGNGVEIETTLHPDGGQVMAASLPPLTRRVMYGNSFQVATTTAAAPVVAIPTTAALIGLYNGEPDNGKCYVIDSVFVVQVVVTAAIQNIGILGNVSQAQIPTAIANTLTPRSIRGGIGYRGAARVAVGITLNAADGVAANWFPIGTTPSPSNTLQIGTIVDADCRGMFIIPPKGQFSLTALAGAATASSIQIGVRWHEVMLPNVI